MIRIGTVGTGFIVDCILENVKKTKGIMCEAVYSRGEERGRKFASKHGIRKVYTNLDEMCQDKEIDVIYIASPNSLHYEQVKQALLYGKHVICEKPFTPTLSEAEELVALAKKKRLLLFEAITTLYHPNYQWIKEHMDEVGDLKMILCTFCQYSSRYDELKEGKITNVFDPDFAGGALMDINLYNIHFIIGLLGAPDRVEYFSGRYENGIDIHGILIMQYGNVICQCTGAKDTFCENHVQIMGDAGYIYVSPLSSNCGKIRLVCKGKEEVEMRKEENQWFYEVAELTRLIEQEDYETCYQNLENTLKVVQVLETARKKTRIEF